MIWVFVIGIVGLVHGIKDECLLANSLLGRMFERIVNAIIFGIIGCLSGTLIACFLGFFSFVLPRETVLHETPIYSVNDNVGASGRFTLGTGYVDSDLCFFYITEASEGKVVEKSKREKTLIVETDAEKPSAKVVGERLRWKWLNLVMVDWNELNDKTILTVPVGTTTTAYSIDLSQGEN